MNDCGVLEITFDMKTGQTTFGGNVKPSARESLIEAFISTQLGAGEDHSKPEERDVYHITLRWNPENDSFRASSDTGNKGLRDGILMYILRQLAAEAESKSPTVSTVVESESA